MYNIEEVASALCNVKVMCNVLYNVKVALQCAMYNINVASAMCSVKKATCAVLNVSVMHSVQC